jgi:TonB family protein
MLAFLVMLACLAMTAAAQTPQVFRPGGDVIPPRVLEKTAPEYTEQARQARLEGSVGLRLVVNVDGEPEGVYVMRSLGLGLDEEAAQAVQNWRFAPGMKDGKAVAVLTTVEVPFHLLDARGDWHLARIDFDPPKGASPPAVEHGYYPEASGPDLYATVSLAFDIDAQGVPVNIRATGSSDAKWEQELIAMLRDW